MARQTYVQSLVKQFQRDNFLKILSIFFWHSRIIFAQFHCTTKPINCKALNLTVANQQRKFFLIENCFLATSNKCRHLVASIIQFLRWFIMDSVTSCSLTLLLHNTVQYINVQSFKRKLSRLGIGHYCNVCLSMLQINPF